MITIGDAVYTTIAAVPHRSGTPVTRRFAENSYEMYAQDTWKVKSNLTLTLGLRYSLFHLPGNQWPAGGTLSALARGSTIIAWAWRRIPSNQQALISTLGRDAPTANRVTTIGILIILARALLLPGLRLAERQNQHPWRIRDVYDRVGESLWDTFDQNGSFGLSTSPE